MERIVVTGKKLLTRSVPDVAAEYIRNCIIDGTFSQGARVMEEDLAESLSVSRACVREALIRLESMGMVVRLRNKYTRIVKFDRQAAEDVFNIRLSLELICCEICLKKDLRTVDELEKQLDTIVFLGKTETHNYLKRIKEDIKFHEIIVVQSGNQLAKKVWDNIKYQVMTLLFSITKEDEQFFISRNISGHEIIIESFKRNKIDIVSKVIRDHIEATLSHILSNMKETGNGEV